MLHPVGRLPPLLFIHVQVGYQAVAWKFFFFLLLYFLTLVSAW